MKTVKLPYIFWLLIAKCIHYCLTYLNGVVLICDPVGITFKTISRTRLQDAIATQQGYTWTQKLWDKVKELYERTTRKFRQQAIFYGSYFLIQS
ncbi:hypothetical protein I8752_19610 [Nostocaceae cyanobacterium CENA369]|uniref:Uncharacterized protein n=1 Tax=Dendronalium phyllosphericum CENA369 TaxID=1725256 RepID=A0A8J7LEQ6_9NOST|nr:hypothetical protein [Dendronalium phyllosphericum]MBH8575182.1 hypothetical protein [Dendronalium phyllosphericum CENA369]